MQLAEQVRSSMIAIASLSYHINIVWLCILMSHHAVRGPMGMSPRMQPHIY